MSAAVSRPLWRLATKRGWRRTLRRVLSRADETLHRRERLGYAAGRPRVEERASGCGTNGRRATAGEE